jgi:hypothetical protein
MLDRDWPIAAGGEKSFKIHRNFWEIPCGVYMSLNGHYSSRVTGQALYPAAAADLFTFLLRQDTLIITAPLQQTSASPVAQTRDRKPS